MPRFDADQLARIIDNLAAQNIKCWRDDEAIRYLESRGAEAAYMAEADGGTLVFRPNPSRVAVVEELIHVGQHREHGVSAFLARRDELEFEAQQKLLEIAATNGWTDREKEEIRRAKRAWKRRIGDD